MSRCTRSPENFTHAPGSAPRRRKRPRIHDPVPHVRGHHPAGLVSRRRRRRGPAYRGCLPTWAITIPGPPTGTCPPRRSCRLSRQTVSNQSSDRRWRHEPDRVDAAVVLHRPARQIALSPPTVTRCCYCSTSYSDTVAGHRLASVGTTSAPTRSAISWTTSKPDRHNSTRTRNAPADRDPLAVHIRHFAASRAHRRVLAIPLKRLDKTSVSFFDDRDVSALLAAPGGATWHGLA